MDAKMKVNIATSMTLLATLFVLMSSNETLAQRGMMGKKSGGRGMGGRMYDSNTVETITGSVINMEKITPTKGTSPGVHLMVKTDRETISVHLGPVWFIENQNMMIEQNDKLGITGSRIEFEGKPAIIAAKVEKGEQILNLRHANGVPVWSGWRRQ